MKSLITLNSQVFIVQGSADHLETLIIESQAPNLDLDFDRCWTCPKTVEPGDLMLIYLLAPISAIVGFAYFQSKPFINDDFNSDWFGKPMAVYGDLQMLKEKNYIGLKELRILFPEWHWTNRPQGAIKVPDKPNLQIKTPLVDLLSEKDKS